MMLNVLNLEAHIFLLVSRKRDKLLNVIRRGEGSCYIVSFLFLHQYCHHLVALSCISFMLVVFHYVVDGIEFARGGPKTTWGSVCAAMGHPQPFDIIGLMGMQMTQ